VSDLSDSELLDHDTALIIVGFLPAVVWVLWHWVRGAIADWKNDV
jgi:hypothetical protein